MIEKKSPSFPSSSSTPDTKEEALRLRLDALEFDYAKGCEGALYEALALCLNDKICKDDDSHLYLGGEAVKIPEWVLIETLKYLRAGKDLRKWMARYKSDMNDYARYSTVLDGMDQTIREEKVAKWSGDDVYIKASRLLEGTPAYAGPDAVRSSYMKLRKLGLDTISGEYQNGWRYRKFKYLRPKGLNDYHLPPD